MKAEDQLTPEETYRRRVLQMVIQQVKRNGLNCREIEEVLAASGYASVGHGTGETVRAYATGKKPISARRIGLIVHALRASGLLPSAGQLQSSALANHEPGPSVQKLSMWAAQRKKHQSQERRALASRIAAIHRTHNELINFLNSRDGSGYDGWDVKTGEMPTLEQLDLVDQTGCPVQFERDKVVRLLQAANDAVMHIELVVDLSGLAMFDPTSAGKYHPSQTALETV